MSTEIGTNLKQVLKNLPNKTIFTAKFLADNGISHDLQKSYERSGWFTRVSNGAYIKLDEDYSLESGVYALQSQLGLSIHVGGLTALIEIHGKAHNIAFGKSKQLFGSRGEKLPKWFDKLFNDVSTLYSTTILPKTSGLESMVYGDFELKVSTPERAILEMIYLIPKESSINEAYQVMELLVSLKPKKVQELLENCSSVKVKRLFLYLAEKAGHSWFKRLDFENINLGTGVREITKGGAFNKKYNIVVGEIEE